MQNSWGLAILIVFVLFSCRKEADPWDREGELETDSTLMIYGVNYVSHSTTQLSVSLDILGVEDLATGKNYNSTDFSNESAVQNVDYSITSISEQSLSKVVYSSVFLFNLNGIEWYKEHYVGFHLRRFYEQIENEGNNKVAFSVMSGQQNLETKFLAENAGDIFGNSWEYNMNSFYQLTEEQGYFQYETGIGYLKERIDDIIDTLNAENPSGDRSITLFSNTDFLNTGDTAIVNAIINKATANGVRINLIGVQWTDQLKLIANKTGGFIAEHLINYDTNEVIREENDAITHVAVTLQNLNDLLSRNVRVHRATFQFDFNDASVYSTGERVSYPIRYKNVKFYIDFIIP